MGKEKIKVYLYTRVSTLMQIDGYSLDAQKTKMKAFCDYNGYEIAGEYEDAGRSGKSIEGREAFNRMMDDIKSGKDGVSFVLVFKLSRFGRNAADVLSALQVMQDYGVNLICVEDGIDSSKDAGKLMISVLSAVAEIERENIRVQTMEGRIQKAREGKWNGGFAPYGYLLNIDDPVNRYLHEWKLLTPDGKESDATIRSILNHTSGIVDGDDSFYGLRRNDPEVSLLDVLEGRTPYNKRRTVSEKQPGTEFEYSDAGFCVLQLMIREITDSAFEEIAAKYVFEPLGLNNTFFASLKNIELREKEQSMAAGYDSEGILIMGKYPQIPDLAASGLWSTPYELLLIAKEFNMALNGRSLFLRRESAQEMIRPAESFSWVGLGLFLRGDDTLVSQGWGENGQSMLKMNLVTGEVSVVMTNQDPGVDQAESGVELLTEL